MPRVTTLPVGPGEVRHALPALRRALDGKGPLLLPVAGNDHGCLTERNLDPFVIPPSGGLAVGTSGSTGAAKRAVLSASALRASVEATHQRLGGPGCWLLALPAQHVAGLMTLIRSMVAGLEPLILDLTGGFSPAAFVTVACAGRPAYTSLVPAQLSRLLDTPGGSAALRRFAAVLVGGGPVPDALRGRAQDAGARVVVTYGMSETCGGCVYDGVALDGVRVRLNGCEHNITETWSGEGRIEIAGPSLAEGYLNDPDRTAAAFGVDPDGTRWLRTDDLGVVDQGGLLTVTGRIDDILISGGVKVWPAQVERALAARLPDGAEVAVVGIPDERWGHLVAAAIVVPPEQVASSAPGRPAWQIDLPDLHRQLREVLPPAALPRRVRLLGRMPTTAIGKPDRARLRDVLARSQWDDEVIRE